MLRTSTALAAAICTIGLIGAPTADAAPKMCDAHGTGKGHIYIAACAGGGGGGGPAPFFAPLRDENGNQVYGANGKRTYVCRSACDNLDHKARVQNPPA